MTMDRHDAIGAMLEDYALGQLSSLERRDVERHIRECEGCATALRELESVVEGLGHSPDPVTPSPGLRQRVLSALVTQPQERPWSGAAGARAIGQPPRSPAIRRGVHASWLAAAAVLILSLGTVLYFADTARRRLANDVRRVEDVAADLRRRLDEYAGQTDLALSILTAGDMRPVSLAGRDNAAASTARAYWSPTRGLLVVADRLPTPPPGRIYQVWIIGGNQPVSAGLLDGQRSGRGMLIVPPPGGLAAGPVTIAVTDEPPGGLPAPTGSMRLVGSL